MEPLLRHIVIAVLVLSFLVFTVFFGRLPVFRKTPIGFLHRVIWQYFPALLRRIDSAVTGGRIYKYSSRTWNYLLYEKHPLVIIFFLGLLTIASALLLFQTYTTFAAWHRLLIPLLLPLPYVFTYLSSRTLPNTVVAHSNHSAQVAAYPYDRILFHPHTLCRTCRLPKPARSKHCSICGTCVARADHHCIWVNNCLGRENYRWFLALLASTAVLLLYGAYLALIVYLYPRVHDRFTHYDHAFPAGLLSTWAPWPLRLKGFREDLNTVMVESIAVGGVSVLGVGLLASMTWPLPLGLLAYHVYLVWAGMTTNEANKWADWRDQMREGNVYIGRLRPSSQYSSTCHAPASSRGGSGAGTPRGRSPSYRGGHGYGHGHARATSNSYAELGWSMSPNGDATSNSTMGRRAASNRSTPTEKNWDDYTPVPPEIKNPYSTVVGGEMWPLAPRQVLVRTEDGELPRDPLPPELEGVDPDSWERCHSLETVENVYDLGFADNLREILKG